MCVVIVKIVLYFFTHTWRDIKQNVKINNTHDLFQILLSRFPQVSHCVQKCPYLEFVFLIRIFPHSDWIRRDTKYLSVFSPNAGKHGLEYSKYGHFSCSVCLRSDLFQYLHYWLLSQMIIPYLQFRNYLENSVSNTLKPVHSGHAHITDTW